MSKIWVAHRTHRKALYLPMQGTEQNPNLMFFLPKMEPSQLDELVRSELQKQGITNESVIHDIIEKAEAEYEKRRKVEETQREVRRLMKIKEAGGKLMQVGFRRWKQVFFRPVGGK
tara:strand:- start:4540 stop:4887 length:348 start_codon:yes stop_codon:yes gene_type:complete